ncbi:MAG: ATP synthase F0 subunit A [Calditrichaeota bacterium]|nr:MAG: ATP synthase F0 subunit A [Calditrichota bacterium]MBL1206697.1 ATP synthase F0 subunit A [Calditrichota bacterium]NOG46523.1 F0F1 ATP synthase subunit A [Calditrichota bacterium]
MTEVTTTSAVSDSVATVPKAAESGNIGQWIIDHISNSTEWHLPFGIHIHLPQFEPVQIGGVSLDFSITNHVVMIWIAAIILLIMFRSVKRDKQVQSGFGMFLEMIVVFVRDEIAISNMGEKHGKKFTPLLVTFFMFIWVANLMGLIPLFSTSTANISVTASLALVTFLSTQIFGVKENGLIGYYKGLVPHGVPGYLWPLMFVVELVGLIAKHVALMIRLFANMTAGHIVLFALIGLVVVFKTLFASPISIAFGLFVFFLELLVATIQAYIFTLLSALFIGMSVNPDH